jgi:GT2 family glycosyltransferase
LAYNLDRLEWPLKKAQLSPQVGSDPKHMSALGWYYFLTGNLSMPKLLFEQEQGFNYAFQGYGWEDLELGYRLSKRKIPLYYLKSAINYHYHVITKDEEIQRNIKKGESARTMYNLHPELKWFLGANPVSLFMFPRISVKSSFYKRMKIWYEKKPVTSIKHKFGFWFLKEYNYIQGFVKA